MGDPSAFQQSEGTLVDADKVKVSANDLVSGTLVDKIIAGAFITLTENNDGGNETLTFAVSMTIADLGITASVTELNYMDGVTSSVQTQLDGKQPLDADLTAIAGLSASNDDFIQRKAGAWANRTIAQVKSDLSLAGTNSGDQTSIVGITGTKAQFDTAVTDGNFLYVGDITQYTDEMAQDAVGGALTDTATIDFTYNDGSGTISADVKSGSIKNTHKGEQTIGILVTDPNGSALTTGDGKAYFRIPSFMNGWDLTAVAASLSTVSSSGVPTVQIRNATQAADMLTTKLTIDASETDSSTAAAAAVIDTANDDVATGDQIYIDIDVAGTGAKGLYVELTFTKP